MFTITVLEILVSEARLVLGRTQRFPGSERIKKEYANEYFIWERTQGIVKSW